MDKKELINESTLVPLSLIIVLCGFIVSSSFYVSSLSSKIDYTAERQAEYQRHAEVAAIELKELNKEVTTIRTILEERFGKAKDDRHK